jgi:hypothetical protein
VILETRYSEVTEVQQLSNFKIWGFDLSTLFSKDGAGTLLHIQVVGSSNEPKFGQDTFAVPLISNRPS